MIVSARDPNETFIMLEFLKTRGVVLPWSTDLRMLGRLNSEEKLIAVVAYNGFVGRTCCMHCAGDGNWISREFLQVAFDYPFHTCKLESIFGTVSAINLQALRLDNHLGFTEVCTVSKGWDGENDLIILKMDKKNCRWIKETPHDPKSISRESPVRNSH